MLERFEGDQGKPVLVDALLSQKIVLGNADLAADLSQVVKCRELQDGETLIEQNGEDRDVFLILAGAFKVEINGRQVAVRGVGAHVGEMTAVQPAQRRSASVIATEKSVVAQVPADEFAKLAAKYPNIYRYIAQELAQRLLERNKTVGAYRDKIRVFIISSKESIDIARAVQNALAYDPITVYLWTDDVFRVSGYTLASLEKQIDDSDFAVAIAHADDMTQSRGQDWPAPRDNVVFELGLFMGRLGRERAILMEPRDDQVKLPSDLAGITTILYRYQKGTDAAASMAPACNKLRDHINLKGAYNG